MFADFFTIKRGLATGGNRYFILSTEEIEERELPAEIFRPILPSPRYVPDNEILADRAGNPVLERQLFLLDCRLPEEKVKERHPTLGAYFEEGKAQGISERYICRHRSPWYAQERRPAAPFLCTYLGRSDKKNGRPFRFILNHSNATAPNVYLMLYPRRVLERAIAESPQLKRQVWDFLNGISPKEMLNEGRVYGGGYTSWSRKSWAGSQRLRLQTYCRKQSGRTSRSNWNYLMLCPFRGMSFRLLQRRHINPPHRNRPQPNALRRPKF